MKPVKTKKVFIKRAKYRVRHYKAIRTFYKNRRLLTTDQSICLS